MFEISDTMKIQGGPDDVMAITDNDSKRMFENIYILYIDIYNEMQY